MNEIGIYIHIPFCKSKCYYCDFTSFSNKENKVKNYIECLKKEIINKSTSKYIVKTIYIGGGTPSHISEEYIEDIISTIKKNYKIYSQAEITIEINPGTANSEKLEKYYKLGINRLSIGLQSSNNNILKSIGRIHTYKHYEETVKLAKKIGFDNINSDIIIGLPNQTVEDVKDSINKMTRLELTHVSVYSLIVEYETILSKKLQSKEIELPSEEEERTMYWNTKNMLEEAGYIHYEISNFAKQGFMSKHNLDCWNQREYLGFGLGASSYKDKIRYSNINNLEEYINNIESDNIEKNSIIEEKQTIQDQMNEYMILGLRKINGVSIDEFKNKFKKNPIELYNEALEKLHQNSLTEIKDNYIKLTDKGIDLANLVWEEFI